MQFSSLCCCGGVSSPPSRERQGGVNRVPQALQACILTITCLTSTRLPGRTEARPYIHTPARSHRGATLRPTPIRSHQGATLRPTRLPDRTEARPYNPRLPGRTEARPYDRMVFSAMYHVENKHSRVAACCDPDIRTTVRGFAVLALAITTG